MTAATTGLLLDPLAEESTQLPAGLEPREPTSAKHSETIAPELEGLQASAAVSSVRALGLIAAIESLHVSDPGRHGLVIDQDPPPGTGLGREGIVILRVGQPAEEPNAEDPAGQPAPAGARDDRVEDDTQAWFATLLQPADKPPPYSAHPSSEETGPHEPDAADTQPLPLPAVPVSPRVVASASRWRRAGLLSSGVAVGAVTVGVLAAHTHARVPTSHVLRPRPLLPALADSVPRPSRARPRPQVRDTRRRHARPIAGFRPARTARPAPALPAAEPAPEADAIQPSPPAATRISRVPPASQRAGQFSYLGQ